MQDKVSSVLYPTPGPFIMPVPDVNHPYSATITGVLETVTTELKLNLKDHILRTVEDYFFNRVEEWYNENFNKKSVPPIPVIDLCDEENEENGMSSTQTTFTRLKFNPPIGPSMTGKESTHVRTRYQCISCMKEYENKSLEELRVEDYAANRKGLLSFGEASQTGSVLGSTPIASTSGFSFGTTQSKLLFGITGTTN